MPNRRFQNLEKHAQASLISDFPGLSAILSDGFATGYQQVAISVYGHWLSEDEACEGLGDTSIEMQKTNDSRLQSFVCSMTSSHESYLVKRVGRYKRNITFRRFRSAPDRNITLTPSHYMLGHASRFSFVVPSLSLVYVEGWDFTHHVYMKDPSSIEVLKAEAERAGVYVL